MIFVFKEFKKPLDYEMRFLPIVAGEAASRFNFYFLKKLLYGLCDVGDKNKNGKKLALFGLKENKNH